MAISAPNTIHLKGEYKREEFLTAEAITPGHLCQAYNASGVEKVKKHPTAKGFTEKMFAVEEALLGKVIGDAYASGDRVPVNIYQSGAEVYAWLKAGTNYVVGELLESAGDGTLQKNSGTADLQTVANLLEATDLSASGAVATRARVRIH